MQKRYLGISRRALMSFLGKQTDLQLTQSRLAETVKKGVEVHHKGNLEADLIEGKKKDVRGLGKGYDWYWLTVIDRLTGFLDVESFRRKTAKLRDGAHPEPDGGGARHAHQAAVHGRRVGVQGAHEDFAERPGDQAHHRAAG